MPVVLWKWNYESKIIVGGREGTRSSLPVSGRQRLLGKQRFFFPKDLGVKGVEEAK